MPLLTRSRAKSSQSLDAIYLKLRPDDEPAEGVLCAWGMTLEGRKMLLDLQLGSRESYE